MVKVTVSATVVIVALGLIAGLGFSQQTGVTSPSSGTRCRSRRASGSSDFPAQIVMVSMHVEKREQ